MALIDPTEFDKGKAEAAEYWRRRGDAEAAAAFPVIAIERCRFGMDARARLAWGRVGDVEVGLRFDLESGAYLNSFIRRPAQGGRESDRS